MAFLMLPLISFADDGSHSVYRTGFVLPGEETNVEMSKERVRIYNFREETDSDEVHNEGSFYNRGYLRASVRAEFWHKNTSDIKETVKVFFPIKNINSQIKEVLGDDKDDWKKSYFPIGSYDEAPGAENFKIYVDGKQVEYETNKDDGKVYFNVEFEGKQEKKIVIEYDALSIVRTKYKQYLKDYSKRSSFEYILQTGRTWKNSIGYGEVIIELPYDYNESLMIFSKNQRINVDYIQEMLKEYTNQDQINEATNNIKEAPKVNKELSKIKFSVDGNIIKYSFKDLEPSSFNASSYYQNLYDINFSLPSLDSDIELYKEVNDNLINNPNDPESHLQAAYMYFCVAEKSKAHEELEKYLNLSYHEKNKDYYIQLFDAVYCGNIIFPKDYSSFGDCYASDKKDFYKYGVWNIQTFCNKLISDNDLSNEEKYEIMGAIYDDYNLKYFYGFDVFDGTKQEAIEYLKNRMEKSGLMVNETSSIKEETFLEPENSLELIDEPSNNNINYTLFVVLGIVGLLSMIYFVKRK